MKMDAAVRGILAVGVWCMAMTGMNGALAQPAWPECAVRTALEGGPAILIDGEPYPVLMMAVNNKAEFGREDVLVREIQLAAEAGVDLFRFEMLLESHLSSHEAAKVVARFAEANPEGYFMYGVWLGLSAEWMAEHPEACITTADGKRLPYASPSSKAWRAEAGKQLRARLRETLRGPHAHQFFGVELAYLQTAEWYYPDTEAFMDYSPANEAGFRGWLSERYGTDAALRAAWGNPGVSLETAPIPSPAMREASNWGPFRNPAEHRPAMDYQRYHSEIVAEAIAYFSRIVKEETQGRGLVAAFYGYTMELNNNGPHALVHSGHLALGKLLRCPDIDIIRAPYAYLQRAVGDPGHIHSPGGSFALHGKLGWYDDDTYTHLAIEPAAHLMAPGWPDRAENLAESIALNHRAFGHFFSQGCGLSFFDLLSEGRWNDPALWDAARPLVEAARAVWEEPAFPPR